MEKDKNGSAESDSQRAHLSSLRTERRIRLFIIAPPRERRIAVTVGESAPVVVQRELQVHLSSALRMRCIERAFDVSAVVEATDDDCCRNKIVMTPAATEAAATDDEVVSRELLEPTAASRTETGTARVYCSSLEVWRQCPLLHVASYEYYHLQSLNCAAAPLVGELNDQQ